MTGSGPVPGASRLLKSGILALGCLACDAAAGAGSDDAGQGRESVEDSRLRDAALDAERPLQGVDAGADTGAEAGPRPVDLAHACQAPQGAFGSCAFSGFPGGCNEAVSAFGTSATLICVEDWGDRPSDGPCSTYGVVGRCYDPEGEYWAYDYGGSLAENARSCEERGGTYCEHGPGLSDALVEACSAACAAKKPEYPGAPECEMFAEECQPMCEQHVAHRSLECAECLLGLITWEQGGCGEWECYCPGPEFPGPDVTACAAACGA